MAPTTTERPALPKTLRRASMWTLIMLAVTALAWALGMPYEFAVLATGPATIIFAIYALISSKGVEAASGIRVWLWIAIGVGVITLVAGLGLILMRGPIERLEACLGRSITETARTECEVQYQEDYQQLLERYSDYGSLTKP